MRNRLVSLGSPALLVVAALLLSSALGCRPKAADEATPADADAADAAVDAPAGGGPSGPPPPWILAANAEPRGVVTKGDGVAPGYVLYAPIQGDTAFLVDQDGLVVHSWKQATAGGSFYLLPDGHLLRATRLSEPPNFKAGGVGAGLEKVTWDGEVVWSWQMADATKIIHHDFEPLPNGNILTIAWEAKSAEEARKAGRRADATPEQGLWSEWLLEIEPVGANDARIVWEWHLWDHLVQDHDPNADNFGDPKALPRRLDINADHDAPTIDEEELARLKALGYVPDDATQEDLQSDFLHMNSVDYNAELDQLLVSHPSISEVWILDHSTTTAEARGGSGGRYGRGGEILYRWGNPKNYRRGTKANQQLFYQHQAEWVPAGYPGAGNITIYNNGQERSDGDYSSIVEVTPPRNADGSYARVDDEPFAPAEPTWVYTAAERETFFAPFISGTHRLANGNTLICEGPSGRIFEVTAAGDVVWELKNPYRGNAPGWIPSNAKQFKYPVFRATKLAPDQPGFAGRTLQPLDPQPPFVPEGLVE